MKIKLKRKKKPTPGGRSAKSSQPTQSTRGRTESFKQVLRKLFQDGESRGKIKRSKAGLLDVALERARRGKGMTDFLFWKELISLHENEALTEEDLNEFVERVYNIVRRSVEKLEGGEDALAEIARNLAKEEI